MLSLHIRIQAKTKWLIAPTPRVCTRFNRVARVGGVSGCVRVWLVGVSWAWSEIGISRMPGNWLENPGKVGEKTQPASLGKSREKARYHLRFR